MFPLSVDNTLSTTSRFLTKILEKQNLLFNFGSYLKLMIILKETCVNHVQPRYCNQRDLFNFATDCKKIRKAE